MWTGPIYLSSPSTATPHVSIKPTLFFPSIVPCLLAVPSIWKLLGPFSVLPFHLNSLFFMFWISCLFPGNPSAPASRLGTSSPLCGTPCIPVALWCNYIADSLEQVSQLLHDWLFFFFFNIPKTWCLILSEASDTWPTWPLAVICQHLFCLSSQLLDMVPSGLYQVSPPWHYWHLGHIILCGWGGVIVIII